MLELIKENNLFLQKRFGTNLPFYVPFYGMAPKVRKMTDRHKRVRLLIQKLSSVKGLL